MPFQKGHVPANKKKEAPKLSAKAEAMLATLDPEEAAMLRESMQEKVEEKEVARQMKSEATRQAEEKHFWVTLIRLPDDNEPHAFVGAAGVPYKINKGVRVPVPESVIHALRYAKVSGYIPVVDDNTGQAKQRRVEYDRYPMQIDGEASLEAVKAWKLEQQRKAKAREGIIETERVEEEPPMGRPEIEFGPTQPMGAGE